MSYKNVLQTQKLSTHLGLNESKVATHLAHGPHGRKVGMGGGWRKPILTGLMCAAASPLALSNQSEASWLPASYEHYSGISREAAQPAIRQAYDLLVERYLDRQPAGTEMEFMRVVRSPDGSEHVRFSSSFEGIRIQGGEVIVHLDSKGKVEGMTDKLIRFNEQDMAPTLTRDEAITLALNDDQDESILMSAPRAELALYPDDNGLHLAWQVNLDKMDGSPLASLPVMMIDAHSGELLTQYDNVQHATGKGSTNYYGTITFTDLFYSLNNYLEDTNREHGTFDARNGTSTYYHCSDKDNTWDASNQRSMVDAYYATSLYMDYLSTTFARKGLDNVYGKGTTPSVDKTSSLVSVIVHYGNKWPEATWISTDSTGAAKPGYGLFGDGDGVNFSSMTSIDIVAHELSHGLIQYTANLGRSNEAGAVNEGMADVFGTLTEFYASTKNKNVKADYFLGEDAYTPAILGDALRYMDNPHMANPPTNLSTDDDADHYTEIYKGTDDSGGIHHNNGVLNKAFYLLAEGGTHHKGGSMVGITQAKAAQIYYRALTTYMTSTTNFSGAREATLRAAKALYGANTPEQKAVDQSWTMVGVTTPTLATVNAS